MSGDTSPTTQRRVDTLTYILQRVTDLVNQVQSGLLDPSSIPIIQDAYNSFLPFIDPANKNWSQDSPIPALFSSIGANPGLANLFPTYFAGDVSGAQLAKQLFEKYASSLFKDISYDVNIKLGKKSQSDQILEASVAQALSNGMFGNSNPVSIDSASNYGTVGSSTNAGGFFNSVITGLMGGNSGVTASNNNSPAPSTHPSTLDWKDRSRQICDQIKKRGLNPNDYGCLQNPDDVDDNFSYRGYAKMVCSRLATNYDPSIPEICGCPPPTWSGWKP
jgi:hypothetical protein